MENFHFYFSEDDLIRAKIALFIWLQYIKKEYDSSLELGYSEETKCVLYKNLMNVRKTLDKFTLYVEALTEE